MTTSRRCGDLGVCRHCCIPLERRRRPYCSVACHRAAENERLVRRWLATGAPRGQSLGVAIREFVLTDQGGVCAGCGLDPVWNGATLVLVLDHIDGDSGNHARSNVRLVCPNCDSQLPTFKSRNRGSGRHARRERYQAGLSY